MPIDIDVFENEDADALAEPVDNDEDELLEFLAYDRTKAYTAREIRASTDLSLIEITARLNQLESQGRVRNKGSYWTLAGDDS